MGKRDNYDPKGKGWFALEGRQKGDRSLREQLIGLESLYPQVAGRSLLDLGCAEGLIALELLRAGAALAHGIEVVQSRVVMARQLAAEAGFGARTRYERGDLDSFATQPPAWLERTYDVVLVLSIAHKMADPAAFLRAAGAHTGDILAVRLPKPVIVDVRSGHKPCDVPALLAEEGFRPPRAAAGPRGEWVGIFERA